MFMLLGVFAADPACALPRFASRTDAKCQSCHINPSGGGMRQPHGVQYGRDDLPVPTWSEGFSLDELSGKLSDFVSIGADFRTLYYYREHPGSSENAFFQMQGDVYMNFRVAKKVSMYLDKGLYNGLEIFGLLNILPANGYIKAGKFLPNYGWKLDDHTTYIRQETGFSAEIARGSEKLTGAEVAVSPGRFTITGGLYNANESFPSSSSSKAVLGRVEGAFKLAEGVGLTLGGNVFTRKDPQGFATTLFGGFGAFSYEDLTVMGEIDMKRNGNPAGATDSTGVILYAEADYVLTPGLDLKFIYDFFDPNKDLKTGSRSRYSFGFEFFPISGVEVRPLYRIVKETPTDVRDNEFHVLVHFYF